MRVIAFLSSFLGIIGFVPSAFGQTPAATVICSDDPTRLALYAGHYTNLEFVKTLEKQRIWNPPHTSAIDITADGYLILSHAWHEVSSPTPEKKLCIEASRDKIKVLGANSGLFSTGSHLFIKTGMPTYPKEPTAIYFRKIFSSCYVDQIKRVWRFSDETVQIGNGRPTAAALILDRMDAISNGISLSLNGDDLTWYFRPTKNNGWEVFRTESTWSENFIPIEKQSPFANLFKIKGCN